MQELFDPLMRRSQRKHPWHQTNPSAKPSTTAYVPTPAPPLLLCQSRSMPPPRLYPLLHSVSITRNVLKRPGFYQLRRYTSTAAPVTEVLPARWLSDLKRRIGKCIIFGLKQEQVDEAGSILKIVAREWRELVAGSEGFLTGRGRAGAEGREVVWGDMVSGPFE